MDVPYRPSLSALSAVLTSSSGEDGRGAEQPAVTVRDVLRLALPPGTTVVGGEDGLDRAVTWARLIQLDSASFERLDPGDLALTSLPPLSDTPHAVLASILQTLASHGISALA